MKNKRSTAWQKPGLGRLWPKIGKKAPEVSCLSLMAKHCPSHLIDSVSSLNPDRVNHSSEQIKSHGNFYAPGFWTWSRYAAKRLMANHRLSQKEVVGDSSLITGELLALLGYRLVGCARRSRAAEGLV